MISPELQVKSVLKFLENARKEKFWGKIVLRFRDGDLFMVEPQPTVPIEKFVSDQLENKNGKTMRE
ncbi:MAG: hypothetical protein WC057_05340 [Dehalococcoidales bacterium]|jgi:hypothetical protein